MRKIEPQPENPWTDKKISADESQGDELLGTESQDSEPQCKGTIMGALLLLVLGLIFFGPMLIDDEILFPIHTATFLPWSDETPDEVLKNLHSLDNPLMGDKVRIFHPQLILNKRSLAEGRLPMWDPYTLCGVPHLAQGLPALFALPNITYLFTEPERSYAITALLQTVLGAILMLLFLRALEIRHFAATMGGFVFGFSGWMLIHLHYFMITGAAMWLPLMLLGVEKIVRGGKPWWIFALVMGTFQSLCAGFPQIAVLNLYIVTAYALVRGAKILFFGIGQGAGASRIRAAVGRVLFIGAGIFLGIVVSGVQLLPMAEVGLSDDTSRTLISMDKALDKALKPACLLTFLAPDIFGHPELIDKTDSPYIKYSSLLSIAMLPQRPEMNYVEIQGYTGFLPLVLALLVFFARPRKGWIFFAVLGAFSLLVALATPGVVNVTGSLPGLLIGDLKRFLFPAVASLSVLAAFTFDAFWTPGGVPRVQIVGFSVLVVLIIAVIIGWSWISFSSEEALRDPLITAIHEKTGFAEDDIRANISDKDFEVQREHILSTLRRTVLHMILAAVVLLLSTGWTRDWTISRPIIVAVLILDLFSVGWKFNKPVPAASLYETANPVVEFLRDNTKFERIIRYRNDAIYPVNTGSLHGVRDTQGYTAFYSNRYRRLLETIEPGQTNDYAVPSISKPESLTSGVLDMMSVKYILASEPIDLPGIEPALQRKSVYIYENKNYLPRAFMVTKPFVVKDAVEAAARIRTGAFVPHAQAVIEGVSADEYANVEAATFPVAIASDLNESVAMHVEGHAGWLILNDTYDKDWVAELDGEEVPIHHANLAFRAIRIPDAEPHNVRFLYKPRSAEIGGYMTLGGLGACLLLVLFFLLRSRYSR